MKFPASILLLYGLFSINTSQAENQKNSISPNNKYSLAIAKDDEGESLVILDNNKKITTLLSGVSNCYVKSNWSADSKKVIIFERWGTKMSALMLVYFKDGEAKSIEVTNEGIKDGFFDLDVEMLGWKGGCFWFFGIRKDKIKLMSIKIEGEYKSKKIDARATRVVNVNEEKQESELIYLRNEFNKK